MFLISGIFTFEASCSPTQTLLLGDGDFILQCSFSLSKANPPEQLLDVFLTRKKPSQTDFQNIVKFFAPSTRWAAQYFDESLTNRSVVRKPDFNYSTSASVIFSDTRCSDLAVYKWLINYYSADNGSQVIERTSEVKVKGKFLRKVC